jgi:hypothetical protein
MINLLDFGKYAGVDAAALVDVDRNYSLWLLGQPFMKRKHPALFCALRRRLAKRLAADVAEEDTQAMRAARTVKSYTIMAAAELGDVSDLV